jgi:hypothetical protein
MRMYVCGGERVCILIPIVDDPVLYGGVRVRVRVRAAVASSQSIGARDD